MRIRLLLCFLATLAPSSAFADQQDCFSALVKPRGAPIAEVRIGGVDATLLGTHQHTTFYVQLTTNPRFRTSYQLQHLLDRESQDPGYIRNLSQDDYLGITATQAEAWGLKNNDRVMLLLEYDDRWLVASLKILVRNESREHSSEDSALERLNLRLQAIFDFNALPAGHEYQDNRVGISPATLRLLDLDRTTAPEVRRLRLSLYRDS